MATELNQRLTRYALDLEQQQQQAASVRKSNRGGFQSKADLLAPAEEPARDRELSSARALCNITPAARTASMAP